MTGGRKCELSLHCLCTISAELAAHPYVRVNTVYNMMLNERVHLQPQFFNTSIQNIEKIAFKASLNTEEGGMSVWASVNNHDHCFAGHQYLHCNRCAYVVFYMSTF